MFDPRSTTPYRNHCIRVLTADDDEIARSVLKVFLEAFDDLEVVATAADGQEAVERCAEARPDVVLMDVKMPVMDGITATRLIRQLFPHVQVVALSAYADAHLAAQILEAGAYSFMSKTASSDQIVRSIREASRARC